MVLDLFCLLNFACTSQRHRASPVLPNARTGGVYSCETRFYISSLPCNAKLINNSIRSHWAVENNLHWCLDVIMKEDGQLNYIGNAAENMNMMKKMELGMLANEKSIKSSKARKMKKALLDGSYRELLLKV